MEDPRRLLSHDSRGVFFALQLILVDRVSEPLVEIAFTPTYASLGDSHLRRKRSLIDFPVHRRSAETRTLKNRFQSQNP